MTMSDPDFEKLFSNPTLGAAANGVFLDVMEAQQNENRAAEAEKRPARIAKRDQRFPGWEQGKDISSSYSDVSFGETFDDESPVEGPQGGSVVPVSGTIVAAREALREASKPLPEPAKTTKTATKGASK